MHIGKILGSVYLAHFSGLVIILVPKRTTGTRTTVKKRKASLGNLFRWGLGPMRGQSFFLTGEVRLNLTSERD